VRHLLKGHLGAAGPVPEHWPVLPVGVRIARWGRLISWPVPQAEQLSVELRLCSGVGAVQDDPSQCRVRLHSVHDITSTDPGIAVRAAPSDPRWTERHRSPSSHRAGPSPRDPHVTTAIRRLRQRRMVRPNPASRCELHRPPTRHGTGRSAPTPTIR